MIRIFLFIFLLISTISSAQNTAKNEYLLAENYYREGAYENATQLYKKLYNASPFNTSYLGRLISCYQETEQFTVAENLLKSNIKANKSKMYLYVYLGYNYEKQQQKELAEKHYKIALNSLDKNGA